MRTPQLCVKGKLSQQLSVHAPVCWLLLHRVHYALPLHLGAAADVQREEDQLGLGLLTPPGHTERVLFHIHIKRNHATPYQLNLRCQHVRVKRASF